MSKRASYKNGVEWIALNDEPTIGVIDSGEHAFEMSESVIVSQQISVILLAELFGKDPLDVSRDVIRKRISLTSGKDQS